MGNGIGGLICTNYIIDSRYRKPAVLVLESPILEFSNSESTILTNLIPLLYSLIPDLIINRMDNDVNWSRQNPFFTDRKVPEQNRGFVDYYFNPLSNRPVYVSSIYHHLRMCNTITRSTPVTIPIFLFCKKSDSFEIETVQKITNRPHIYMDQDFSHEIMLDTWSNITKCIGEMGKEINRMIADNEI